LQQPKALTLRARTAVFGALANAGAGDYTYLF
jgi:hypothetical protein